MLKKIALLVLCSMLSSSTALAEPQAQRDRDGIRKFTGSFDPFTHSLRNQPSETRSGDAPESAEISQTARPNPSTGYPGFSVEEALTVPARHEPIPGVRETNIREDVPVEPDNGSKDFKQGVALLQREQFEEAAESFTRAIQADPNNADAFLNRAECFRAMRRYEFALGDAAEALRLSSQGWTSRGGRSVIDFTEKRNRESVIRMSYEKRGEANFFLNHDLECVEDYTKAISYGSSRSNTYFYRGEALYNLGRYERAMEDYTRALELGSGEPELYCLRGLTYLQLRNPDAAASDFSVAFSRDPSLKERYAAAISNVRRKSGLTISSQLP